jgi:hypothetical protein
VTDYFYIPLFLAGAAFFAYQLRKAARTGEIEIDGLEADRTRNPLGFRFALVLTWFWFIAMLIAPLLIIFGWKGFGR